MWERFSNPTKNRPTAGLLLKQRVYHVGQLEPDLHQSDRRHASLEGAGLSVSEHPTAWRTIAKLGGFPLYVLKLRDGTPGRFVDLTAERELKYVAVSQGLLRPSPVWRLWSTDEEGEERYMEFADAASAEREAGADVGDRVEQVSGFTATPKLHKLWAKDFHGKVWAAVSMGVLYALEASGDADGAWWNEILDPANLSAPRGVIFRSRLSNWQAQEIPWAEAPDADEDWR